MFKKLILIASSWLLFNFCDAKKLVNLKQFIPTIEIELKYATKANFTKQQVYNFKTCYVLEDVAVALKQVQAALAIKNLGLKIWDGFRPRQAQIKFWQICPDERYVSNPYTKLGRHTRGTAIDVTLIDLKTKIELIMPTEFDDFSVKAAPDYVGPEISELAIKNRAILKQVMYEHSFTNYLTEWWHFDYAGWENCAPLDLEPQDQDIIEI
ncbi:MAG TPA: M15 family metallopeptidase [Candidatus Babeliales bacterium]|nr:M15 family metallopeptidase [Candidatus Babeliales bacterium]